jgi:hypothetical protein
MLRYYVLQHHHSFADAGGCLMSMRSRSFAMSSTTPEITGNDYILEVKETDT